MLSSKNCFALLQCGVPVSFHCLGVQKGTRRMSREEGRRRAGPEFSEHRRRPGSPRSSPSGRGRPQRGFTSGRGRYGEPRPSDIPAPLLSALDKGEVFCNAWTLRFTKPVQAWGYPLKIWESTLGESPEAVRTTHNTFSPDAVLTL